jgi:hypothetical protein
MFVRIESAFLLDTQGAASLWLRKFDARDHDPSMPFHEQTEDPTDRSSFARRKTRAILTDSHFLIPLIVFFVGLALLITLH